MNFLDKLHAEIQSRIGPEFQLPEILFNGANVRFDINKMNDKAGWVYVNSWDYKGNEQHTATFGSWRSGAQFTVTSYDQKTVDKPFKKAEKKQIQETQQKIEDDKQLKYQICREKWGPIYEQLSIFSTLHAYCDYKKITSNYHGRVDFNGVLYIPSYNERGFVGCQRIFVNPEYSNVTGKDNRRFIKKYTFGIEKIGSFCPFGNIRTAEYIFVGEGFATMGTVFEAVGNENSAAAAVWDTSNIYSAILSIRKINPGCKIIICADRDLHPGKPFHKIGERKARQAAFRVSNCIVRLVEFDETAPDDWSDFNDLHCFDGIEQVVYQLQVDAADFVEIIPLGHLGKKSYYFATHSKRVWDLTTNEHNKAQFITMSGSIKYWGDRYGWLSNSEGEQTGPNYELVLEKLSQETTEKGFFNPENIRGQGCWYEKGEIAVNLGDKIFHKNEYKPIFNHDIDTKFFYEAGESVNIDLGVQLNYEQAQEIANAFKMLRYKNQNDYIFLLGWIVVAQIAGALPWRPHLYLTGAKGNGKSTILSWIHSLIFNATKVTDSTAAGIKQNLKNNAKAVIYDESEPNTEKDRNQMADVIKLARHCSDMSTGDILRGTAGGTGVSYNTNAIFCLGSIQKIEFNSADDSRFFVIEMNSVKDQSHDEYIQIENLMAKIKSYTHLIYSRSVNQYKTIMQNIELCKIHIKTLKYESRVADQLAPILAGYYSLFSNELMERETINTLIEMLNFKSSEYVEANAGSDSERCYDAIMQISPDGGPVSVSQLLELMKFNNVSESFDAQNRLLEFNGIKFIPQSNEIFFALGNVHLKEKLKRISSYTDYISVLKRHPKFSGYKNSRLGGRSQKGVFINLG